MGGSRPGGVHRGCVDAAPVASFSPTSFSSPSPRATVAPSLALPLRTKMITAGCLADVSDSVVQKLSGYQRIEKRRLLLKMIILDVPSVWGRLMLVDMAGSEDIEAAGQTGFEAKMQARLEVMGKKAKNATYISGNEAGKISREVAEVEKWRPLVFLGVFEESI